MTAGRFSFDQAQLDRLVEAHHEHYNLARPFPHIVIDDFLPATFLDEVVAEFPDPDGVAWRAYDSAREQKLEFTSESMMGDATRQLLAEFHGSRFVDFLERLTGIRGLIPDPHLEGGGLHQIARGGFLKIHADFNRHKRLALDRRLNLLLYLNRGWLDGYGGHLELWERQMRRCEVKILPVFNRCVVFSTTSYSYHGHPEALTCPAGTTRKSLALYYYTNGRPPDEVVRASHGTLFQTRPGDEWSAASPARVRPSRAKGVLRQLLPPILVEAARAVQTAGRRRAARGRDR